MSSFCARAPSATSAGTRRRATDNVASQTPSLLELAETLAFAAMQSPARARWRRLGCARSPSKAKDSCTVRGVSCAICGRIPTSDGCSRHKTSWKNPAGCRPAGFERHPGHRWRPARAAPDAESGAGERCPDEHLPRWPHRRRALRPHASTPGRWRGAGQANRLAADLHCAAGFDRLRPDQRPRHRGFRAVGVDPAGTLVVPIALRCRLRPEAAAVGSRRPRRGRDARGRVCGLRHPGADRTASYSPRH